MCIPQSSLTQQLPAPQQPKPLPLAIPPQPDYGARQDGPAKGRGYFGELQRPDGGGFSTEVSVGVNIGGKDMEIPAMVPSLNKKELNTLLTMDLKDRIPRPIIDKAVAHAKQRMGKGLSPFAAPGESFTAVPNE